MVEQTSGQLGMLYEAAKESPEDAAKAYRRKNVDILRQGTRIILPDDPAPMPLETAISVLQRKQEAESKVVSLYEKIEALVLDGARAFQLAANEMFGWTEGMSIETFFGERHPVWITISTGPDTTEQVLWGRIAIPGTTIQLHTDSDDKGHFVLQGQCEQRHRPLFNALAFRTRQLVKEKSIYKSKAFTIAEDEDNPGHLDLHDIKFMQGSVQRHQIIMPEQIEQELQTCLYNPIEYTQRCRQLQVPLNRGVLLYGPFGVGKTLTGGALATCAIQHGWTFIHLKSARTLVAALEHSRLYEPAVLYVEDVDRVLSGDRSLTMDQILNAIDGVNTKGRELLTVLTTNDVEMINPAMLRPGRLDAIIEITLPDEDAAARLARLYGRGLIPDDEDLTDSAKMMAGHIPATIREIIERAKLAAIPRIDGAQLILKDEDIAISARTMIRHGELMQKKPIEPNRHERLGRAFEDILVPKTKSKGKQMHVR